MISVAIQKGNYVQIFNEKNYLIKNVYVYTYDEKGHMLSQKYSKEG